MPRQIIIHAGQHKTGSTSIQHYIERHPEAFRRHGIEPCRDWTADLAREDNPALPYNARSIANGVIRASLMTPKRLEGAARSLADAEWAAAAARLNAHFRALPGERILLSAEAFSFLREAEERRRLEQLCAGFAVKPILFLRDPPSWLESWRSELRFSKMAKKPGAVPGQGILDVGPSSWLADHAAIRAFWGPEAVILGYEDALSRHGSVIPAFLEALGIDPATCPPWRGIELNTTAAKRTRFGGQPG
jgi:hypothetical protein